MPNAPHARAIAALAAAVLALFGTALAVAADRSDGSGARPSVVPVASEVTPVPALPTTAVPTTAAVPPPATAGPATRTVPKASAPRPSAPPPVYTPPLPPPPPVASTPPPPPPEDGVCTLNEARGVAGCPPGTKLPGPYVTEDPAGEPGRESPWDG